MLQQMAKQVLEESGKQVEQSVTPVVAAIDDIKNALVAITEAMKKEGGRNEAQDAAISQLLNVVDGLAGTLAELSSQQAAPAIPEVMPGMAAAESTVPPVPGEVVV
jgi:uncharacterized protein YjgD (DUF1641 family)